MDINQDSAETGKQEPQVPKVSLPKLRAPKKKLSNIPEKIKWKLKEYKRVLMITKKPTQEEFKAIVKASGIGIIIIGLVGFTIHMIVQLLYML